MEKRTKVENFAMIRDIILDAAFDDETLRDELVEFVDKQVEMLEKRKEAAQARAAKKREESDELTDAIFGVITGDLMTVDEILAQFDENDEEITRNKVTARLGKLVKSGKIVKEAMRVDGKKKMAYCLAEEAVDIQ